MSKKSNNNGGGGGGVAVTYKTMNCVSTSLDSLERTDKLYQLRADSFAYGEGRT
jgi:hypothetical protein